MEYRRISVARWQLCASYPKHTSTALVWWLSLCLELLLQASQLAQNLDTYDGQFDFYADLLHSMTMSL